MTDIALFLIFTALAVVIWWIVHANLRARELEEHRQRQEQDRIRAQQPELVRALIRGQLEDGFEEQLFDAGFRKLQIIGESMRIINKSVNPDTIQSRTELIHTMHARLQECWRETDLTAESLEVVAQEVADFLQNAAPNAAVRMAGHYIDKAEAAKRKPTQLKYLRLAQATLQEAIALPQYQAHAEQLSRRLQPLAEVIRSIEAGTNN